MIEMESLGSFEDQIAALEDAMAGARDVTAGLSGELTRASSALSDASSGVSSLSVGLGRNLSRAFESVVFDGMKLSDALTKVGRSMVNSAFSAAVKPVSARQRRLHRVPEPVRQCPADGKGRSSQKRPDHGLR